MNFNDKIGHAIETASTGAVGTATSLFKYIKQIVTNTYRLAESADGTDPYPASVANDSLFAKMLAKGDPANASTFNNTTDSLEAISDLVTTADAVVDDIDADLGEPGDAAAINTTVHAKLNGIIAALEITAAGGGKFEVDGAEGLWTQLKEVPASDGAVTWNNTALASINAEVDTALNTIVPASPTAGSVNDILSVAAGANTFNKATDSLEALRDRIDTLNLADQVDLDAILADTGTDGVVVNSYTTAASRIVGKTQVIEVSVTSAANAGDVTLATITTQPCLIKSIVVHADTAAQAALTNIGVYGGASKVVTFIDTVTGVKANIDAVDEQVAWTGAARFAAAKTIVITLTGTGVTPVDLTVTIEYEACVAGGYLA